MIFPKIVPTRVFTTKIEKTFFVFSSEPVSLFLERASCCCANSTHLNPALYAAGKVTVGSGVALAMRQKAVLLATTASHTRILPQKTSNMGTAANATHS